THGLALGLTLQIPFSESVLVDINGSGLVGTSIAYPFVIGSPGLAAGFTAGAAFRVKLSDFLSFVASYQYRYRQQPFSGQAKIDPTITKAMITHLDNGFGAGLSLTF